jgi:hypothetical protein
MTAMKTRSITTILAVIMFASATLHAAEKLKGIYTGSGGFSQEVHRVLMVEFGEDGTAILQQNWEGKEPQIWHAKWTQNGKVVNVVFDVPKDAAAIDPLVCEMKHGELIPTKWDVKSLGLLGPPKLTPFGGTNPQQHSVATCQSMNTRDPSQNCTTWNSRTK